MYIWLTNFGYEYSAKPQNAMEGAEWMARIGFECTLHDEDGRLLAYFNPISGRVTTY